MFFKLLFENKYISKIIIDIEENVKEFKGVNKEKARFNHLCILITVAVNNEADGEYLNFILNRVVKKYYISIYNEVVDYTLYYINKRQELMMIDLINEFKDEMLYVYKKNTKDSEYLAICNVWSILCYSVDSNKKLPIFMNLINNNYNEHFNDLATYIGMKTGELKYKKEFEEKILERHILE